MQGTHSLDGKPLGDLAHLRQSIADILTTPIGSRVMLPAYGSRLYELLDAPLNRATVVALYAATAEALAAWEPRFQLQRVAVLSASAGTVELELTGIYSATGELVTLTQYVST